MPSLRLCTFNVENLLMRCDFARMGVEGAERKLNRIRDSETAERVDAVFNVLSEDDRTLTAQALAATRADVCALQEVENLVTLTAFHNRYLMRWMDRPYQERILYPGNDGRGIDVALLSRLRVLRHKSHAGETFESLGISPPRGKSASARLFRRDCLEVDIEKDGRALTLFICHFKSMHGGREETREIRALEAEAVRRTIERRFANPQDADWIILGDLNDYLEIDGIPASDHSLGALVNDGFAVDLAKLTIPGDLDRWSHHYTHEDTYSALDHMLVSPSIAGLNKRSAATYVRAGVPWRCARHTGWRFPGIGWAHPKASDHCPFAATIQFTGYPVPG